MAINNEKKTIHEIVKKAERNARKRELESQASVNDVKLNLLEQLKELTGEDYGLYQKKGQNKKVPFVQLMHTNIHALVQAGYLKSSHESFLFRIGTLLEFGSNCIVEVQEAKKTKKQKLEEEESGDFSDITKAASVNYIAEQLCLTRQYVSKTMNELKKIGILATAGTGIITENGRVCTSRTWFVNPNIIYKGDKDNIQTATQHIFHGTLNNLVDKNGKKFKLPVRLFV